MKIDLTSVIYVFECPVHGNEIDVLCWRAFQSELKSNWHKFFVTEYREVEFDADAGELDWIIEKFKSIVSRNRK